MFIGEPSIAACDWRRCLAPGCRRTSSARIGCLLPEENRHFIQTSVATSPRKAIAFFNSLTIDDPDEPDVARLGGLLPARRCLSKTYPLRNINLMEALLIAQP